MGEQTGDVRGRGLLLVVIGVIAGWTAASFTRTSPAKHSPAVAAFPKPGKSLGWVWRWTIQLAIGVTVGAAVIVISFNYKGFGAPWWPDVKPIITLLVALAALVIGSLPDRGWSVRTTPLGELRGRSKFAWVAIALGLFGIIDAYPDAVEGISHLVSKS